MNPVYRFLVRMCCNMTAGGCSTVYSADRKAGGPKHEMFGRKQLEVSISLWHISHEIQVLVNRCTGPLCQQWPQTNTHLSVRVMTTASQNEGVRKRLAAAEIDRGRERGDGGGEKTEKGKQFFCVSHRFTVVQFLLLSSTGNNHERGWLPGQLAPLSLLHASKCRVWSSSV